MLRYSIPDKSRIAFHIISWEAQARVDGIEMKGLDSYHTGLPDLGFCRGKSVVMLISSAAVLMIAHLEELTNRGPG
jgi:hypothetical protein